MLKGGYTIFEMTHELKYQPFDSFSYVNNIYLFITSGV